MPPTFKMLPAPLGGSSLFYETRCISTGVTNFKKWSGFFGPSFIMEKANSLSGEVVAVVGGLGGVDIVGVVVVVRGVVVAGTHENEVGQNVSDSNVVVFG